MYARLTIFSLEAGSLSTALKVVDLLEHNFQEAHGFKGITYFQDDDKGEYGALSFWETNEDAETATQNIFPKFKAEFSSILKDASTHIYKVINR